MEKYRVVFTTNKTVGVHYEGKQSSFNERMVTTVKIQAPSAFEAIRAARERTMLNRPVTHVEAYLCEGDAE